MTGFHPDCLFDALEMEKLGKDQFLSEIQLGYLAECYAGEMLSMWIGGEEDAHFVKGTDREGSARFETKIVFRAIP